MDTTKKLGLYLSLLLIIGGVAVVIKSTCIWPRTRIAMVTVSTPNRTSFTQYTIGSFKDYAQRWGYELHYHQATLDASRPVQWSKIKAVQELLKTNKYDWVVWVDDDIFITNPDHSFESMISSYGNQSDIIISAHKEKLPEFNDVNTGLFFAKNTDWVRSFLQRVWDIGHHRYNKATGSFWEQSAMQELLETKEFKGDSHVSIVPARKIQSFITLLKKGDKGDYGQWQPGDFAAHLAGAGEYVRIFITQQLKKNPRQYPHLREFAHHFTIQQS